MRISLPLICPTFAMSFTPMLDAIYLAIMAGFGLLSLCLIVLCEWLMGGSQ